MSALVEVVAVQFAEVAERWCADEVIYYPLALSTPAGGTCTGYDVDLRWFYGDRIIARFSPYHVELLLRRSLTGPVVTRRRVGWDDPALGEYVARTIGSWSGRRFPADWMEWEQSHFTDAHDAIGGHDHDLFPRWEGEHEPCRSAADAQQPAELAADD